MSEPQLVSADPNYGLAKSSPDDLLKQARAAADAGDVESANAAFFQIPQGERARRGLYSGPGGGDATGPATLALAGATGIAGIARAVGGAGPSIGARTVAGAKAAVTQLTPVVKYEATKTMLTRMGVPEPLAVAAAIGISGYRMGGKAATAAETSAAESAPAAASARAAPTSPVGSTAGAARPQPTAGSPPSVPQTAGSALRLTTEEQQALDGLVKQGYSRDAVLAQIEKSRPAAPPMPARKPAELTLKSSETKEYMRLLKSGKTSQEARELIQAQRDLVQRLGVPTSEDARRAVQDRNTSGRWPE